jgi:hypothetical protein
MRVGQIAGQIGMSREAPLPLFVTLYDLCAPWLRARGVVVCAPRNENASGLRVEAYLKFQAGSEGTLGRMQPLATRMSPARNAARLRSATKSRSSIAMRGLSSGACLPDIRHSIAASIVPSRIAFQVTRPPLLPAAATA